MKTFKTTTNPELTKLATEALEQLFWQEDISKVNIRVSKDEIQLLTNGSIIHVTVSRKTLVHHIPMISNIEQSLPCYRHEELAEEAQVAVQKLIGFVESELDTDF